MAPPVVLIAQTEEEKDKMMARFKAQHDEDEKKMHAMDEEHEKMEAQLKAQKEEIPATPGPVVKAIIGVMDEDHMKEAKQAIMKAMDEEHDDEKKSTMQKALKSLEEIFETGNGTNTNARHGQDDEEKKEQTAVIAALTAKVAQPIINEILTAKVNAGATEKQIKEDSKRLAAMSLPQVEQEYKSQEIFIKQALTAEKIEEDTEALTAKFEGTFDFNGVNALTAKTVDVDEVLEAVQQ